MPEFKLVASLPFPLRVNPRPYQIATATTTWLVSIERVPREHPDERIVGLGTNVDLLVDRAGQLAYSRVTGSATFEGDGRSALNSFLGALNTLIRHVRDVFGEYWIRTLGPADLYQVHIQSPDAGTSQFALGQGQGTTLPVVGRTEERDEWFQAALASGKAPPVWRLMHLDARDALELGRCEDCVVLAWSALEAACRQALPGMAYQAGLSVGKFAAQVDSQKRWSKRMISYEEVLEKTSGGLKIVNAAAELTQPQVYHPDSVTNSVRLAYELRNRIVHQGVRVSRRDAHEVWRAVDSAFTQGLSLRDIPPPPELLSWRVRFKRALPDIQAFVATTGKRLVLTSPGRDDSPFRIQLIGDDLWLRFADDLTQPMAIALVLAYWDSWDRERRPMRPQLRPGHTSGLFLEGLLDGIASEVQRFVCLAESMLAVHRTHAAMRDVAAYALAWHVAKLASAPTIAHDDQQWVIRSALLAAHLALLPKGGHTRRLRPLKAKQPLVYQASAAWAETMTEIDPNDEHSSCPILRRIHSDTDWLDSIMVVCPGEQVAYGSRHWPLSEAPLQR